MSDDKTTTRNRGEVSEFYSFVYIIGNRCVPLVDGNLLPIGRNIRFLKLFRKEEVCKKTKVELRNEYELDVDGDEDLIRVTVPSPCDGGSSVRTVSRKSITERLDALKLLITNMEEPVPADAQILEELKQLLMTKHLAAKSSDKSDYSGVVSSSHTPEPLELGFSVKSQMGSPSTLINANVRESAFQYRLVRVDGNAIKPEAIESFRSKDIKGKQLIKELMSEGYDFEFVKVRGEALEFNLRLMDSEGPDIMAALLLERYRTRVPSTAIHELIKSLSSDSAVQKYPFMARLGHNPADRQTMLSYKLKNILLGFAAGATVSKKWDGIDRANGGLLVVTHGGDVVCLELFTRNAIGQYLLTKTFFDNPSTTRHKYGRLYQEGNDYFIDFQLQVRFKG